MRTVLTVDDGHITLTSDPEESLSSDVTIVVPYADALAMRAANLTQRKRWRPAGSVCAASWPSSWRVSQSSMRHPLHSVGH